MDYTLKEMMAIMAAREIHDGDIVFCGTGISMVTAMAAKHINAPESIIFFETGAIDPKLEEIPMAVADPRVMYGAASNSGLAGGLCNDAESQDRQSGHRHSGGRAGRQVRQPQLNLHRRVCAAADPFSRQRRRLRCRFVRTPVILFSCTTKNASFRSSWII